MRETEKAIPDWVFNRMTENLGVAGADVISLAKKFKAEEIPGAIQGFLSYAISAGKATSEQVAKDLKKLGFDTEVDAQGHIFIDNSDEAVKDVDWNSVLLYLNKLGILEQAAEGDFKFKEGAVLSDVMNRADTWDVSKGVKVGYKESAGVKRDVAIAASQTGKDYSEFEKDIDKIFDPTFGGRGEIAEKARRDREAILDITSGSIVKTYKSQIASSREADVEKLKKSSYKGRTRKGKRKYIISVGNGSGYTIDVNQLLNEAIDYTEGGGSLTPEEYGKTVLGAIDAVKTKILSKIPDAEIDVAIDPGTDFGFGMSFGEGGVEEGATGRFVYLPNVETDVRFDGKGNGLYDLPEYATALHSLIGSMKVGGIGASEKAQELTKGIFTTAHSSKGTLYERAFTKRIGPSHGGHITAMSRVGIDDLLRQSEAARLAGDETTAKALDERARRLMSSVWVSQEVATNLLRNREQFTDAGGKYDVGAHGEAVFSALRYLRGDDAATTAMHAGFKTLSEEDQVKTINDLIPEIVSLITEQPGEAGMKRGLIGMFNRFPSISKHPEVFGEMLVSGGLKGFDMEIGPALAKFLNGDYDGDTAYLILGLWSSGMSFDAAAEMVERQKDINKHVYQTMLNKTEGDTTAAESGEIGKISDPARMGLSALATKFNKPYTGMFSNMSTRIREGLRATGYDYIDEQGRPNFNLTGDNLSDYIAAIQGELVTTVGQILEQDSISAKKVDKRIEKMRASIGRELKPEEVDKIEQEVLHEFEELDAMLRNPDFSYEQIIERMKEMGLFADEATQITATLTGQIKSLTSKLSPEQQETIYKKLGLSTADIEKGIVNPEAFKMAGASIERELSSREGKDIRIFAGEYGTGFATSRKYTESMKDDTYELLRYVKQLNGALKQTGEIIDENGNKFSEYGEKIKGAKTSLQGEAAQESAKVAIAAQEGKTIERNVDIYQKLSEKLETAGNNYNAINRLSTSELKSRLLPYGGEQTTGIDEKTLNSVYRKIKAGKTFTKAELAAQFGVEDEKALNSLFLGNLSTVRGNYIHNLSQGDVKGARKEKLKLQKMFGVLGYSDEQIASTFDTYKAGAKNVKAITKQYGMSLGSEIPFIGMTSDGQYVVNARGDEFFVGERKNPFYDKDSKDPNQKKTQKVFTAVDYKTHTSGKLEDSDIVQGVIYKTFLEDLQTRLKGIKGDVDIDSLRAEVSKGMKYTSKTEEREALLAKITPELIKNLKEADVVQTEIIVVNPSTGSAQAYSIGADKDKFKVARDIILSGDTSPLTSEEKTSVKSVAKKRTDARYFKPGDQQEGTGSIEDKLKQGGGVTAEQRNESQKEYNTLVSEEFKLKKEIAALDKERWKLTDIEGKKSADYAVQNLDAEKQWRQDELKRMQDRKTELEGLGAVESKATTASNEEKMTAYLTRLGVGADGKMALTPEEQADYWSQYERALDKQARAEEEIFGIRNKAAVSYDTEKNLLYQIADEKEKALATDKENVTMLEKIVGKLDPTRLANIKEQVALNQQLYKLQSLKQTRGATSIWDVMANDIRRATMRIADFGIAAKVMNKIPQDIQKIVQYTKELDKAMTNVRIVGGYTAEQAKTLTSRYTELGRTLGATTTEIAEGMDTWLRQGYEAQDQLESLVTASTKLSRLGMISASEATNALTAALKAFNLAADDAIRVVDKLTKIDQLAAVSAGGISQALQKSATSAKLAGMSMDELIGSVSVIGEVTQQSMDTVGNAMKSILARYGNVKASVFTQMGLNDDGETSENINDIEKVLSKLGIRMRSSSTELRDITDVLDEVNEKWDTYDTVTKNALATAFGGTRMRENFLVLMENWDRVKELTEESANAAGTADEKYTAHMESIEAATKLLQNAWERMSQKFESSWLIKLGTNALAGFIGHFDTLVKLVATFASVKFSDQIFEIGKATVLGAPKFFKKLLGFGDSKQRQITYDANGNPVINPAASGAESTLAKLQSGTTQAVQTSNGLLQQILAQLKINGSGIVNPEYDDSGKITKGLAINGRRVVVKTTKTGKPAYYYENGGMVRSSGNIQKLNAQQAAITKYNAQIGTTAAQNQISGYTGRTWAGYARQVNIGDRAYYRFKDGSYVTETGEILPADQQKNVDKINKQLRADKVSQRAKQGVAAGLTTAISELMTTKEIGSGIGGTLGKLFTGNKDNEQTVEETAGGKALRTALAGGLSGVLGAYFGPLGAMVGQIAGEGISGIISTIVHRSELEMKQRVADAKENLSKLSEVQSSIDENSDVMQKAILESDDEKQLEKYVDTIRDFFIDNTDFISSFLEKFGGEYDSVSAVLKDINAEDVDFRSKVESYFEETVSELKTDNTLASQEEDRAKIAELYGLDIQGITLEEKLASAKQTVRELKDAGYTEGPIEYYESIVQKLEKAIIQEEKLNKKWLESAAQEGYLRSEIKKLSKTDLTKLGLEGAISSIADQMEQQGISVRTDGKIHKDVYDVIKSAIKEDAEISSALERGSLTIGEYIQDSTTYADRIEQFALAFNITEEEALKMGKTFKDLTIELGNMTPSDVLEYYQKFSDVLSEVTSSGGLTAKTLNTIVENLPRLTPYIFQGADALESEIYKAILGGEMDFVYENALNSQIFSNEGVFEYFKTQYSNLSTAAKEKTTLLGLKDLIESGEATKEDAEAYYDFISNKEIEYQKDLTVQNQLREYQISLIDDEVNNLEEQKSALSDINEQRKKEIDYIKAKNALENAQKEKKRVFRSGIGWSYEVDETAISEAKEKVDSLQVERDQEAIQYQIDAINAQKAFLEALPDQAQNERLKTLMDEFTKGDDSMLERVKKLSDAFSVATTKMGLKEPSEDNDKNNNTIEAKTTPTSAIEAQVSGLGGAFGDSYNSKKDAKLNKELGGLGYTDKGFRGFDYFELTYNGKKYQAGSYNHGVTNIDLIKRLNKSYGEGTPIRGEVIYYEDPNGKATGLYTYNNENDWRKVVLFDDLSDDDPLKQYVPNASGTISFPGGQTLINELGTEAVITPGGTLTALPSKTGIVPADITKNVWALGEVAPTLIARLSSLTQKPLAGNGANTTYEEGQYIDNLTMNVYPAKGDDFNKILEQARAQVRLTRRNN